MRGSSPKYHGVTYNAAQRRWGAHVWDPDGKSTSRIYGGRQCYLGSFMTAEEAALSADVAKIKLAECRNTNRPKNLNFPDVDYHSILRSFAKLDFDAYLSAVKGAVIILDTAENLMLDLNRSPLFDTGCYLLDF